MRIVPSFDSKDPKEVDDAFSLELIEGNISISQLLEVSPVDLLGREEISLDKESIKNFISGKRVLVTGAGGSIGSELSRQIMKLSP